MIRLDKFLANSGIGTRKEVKDIIKKGLVKINDMIVKSSDFKLDIDNDVVIFNGKEITYKKYRYIMLNKPKDYISATYDNKHKTVLDLIKGFDTYNLFPIGRLDIDTEGLLILTNDGMLTHNLLSPNKHIEKVYYVILDKKITLEECNKIENGIILDDGYLTKESKIELIDDTSLYITITEGKFHQVKRMFLAINNKVNYLKRIQMGNLKLDENLKLGQYRELSLEELERLKK